MRCDALVQMGQTVVAGIHCSFRRASNSNPKLTEAHVLLGKAYRTARNDEQALHHLERGAQADTDGSLHYQLFMLYRKTKQPEKAKAALKVSQTLRAKDQKPTL